MLLNYSLINLNQYIFNLILTFSLFILIRKTKQYHLYFVNKILIQFNIKFNSITCIFSNVFL
jgi:hypothetical protein